MEVHNDWYRGIVKEVTLYKDRLSKRDYKNISWICFYE